MTKYVILLISCISLMQCTHEKLTTHYLVESKKIDLIDDTLLFKDIRCLTFYNNRLYFTNPIYDQVVSLNKNLDLEKTFGEKGNGPNELLDIDQFTITDSLISVLNVSNRRINIFSVSGEPLIETSISNSIHFDTSYRFCFVDSSIVGSSDVAEAPLSKYNIYTSEQTLFGKTYQFPTPKQTSIRNNRFTSKIDDGFIVVSNNLPFIEIYNSDNNFEQVVQYNYSDIIEVHNSIRAIESANDKTDNSYRHLCEDIYVTNRYLYILLIDYTNNDFNVNQIIKFKIRPVIEPVSIYKLPGKYFKTFCISEEDGIVYAYHYTDNTLGAYLINQTTDI